MDITGSILRATAIVLGALAMPMIFYGGLLWIFAGGVPQLVAKAKAGIIGGTTLMILSAIAMLGSEAITWKQLPDWRTVHMTTAAIGFLASIVLLGWAGRAHMNAKTPAMDRKALIIMTMAGTVFLITSLMWIPRELDWEKTGQYMPVLPVLAAGGAAWMRDQPPVHTGLWAAAVSTTLAVLTLGGESAPAAAGHAACAALGAHGTLAFASRAWGHGPLRGHGPRANSVLIGMDLGAAAAILITA